MCFVCFVVLCRVAHAQVGSDSLVVQGRAMDSFTHELLSGVHVEIMREDSSLVAELVTSDQRYNVGGITCNVSKPEGLYLPRERRFILRYSKEGYEAKCFTENLKFGKREYRVQLSDVLLVKKRKEMQHELGEATVVASKVRMVVRGDTIIYNADAFQLAKGSMLDGLIKILPGFELRGGGIYVNGEYVSSLLVNGEDFFKGDPRVALENLPAYIVDKVKVYRKEHDHSYITGVNNKDELPMVVDVNLKRQYAVGWVANAEMGYGLEDRYLARIFGLRFTDNSRLALYGNANNTNDTREPGTSGDWNSARTASGRTDMQTGGFETFIKDKMKVWKYTGNAKVFREKIEDESMRSAETFLANGGSTYGRRNRISTTQNIKVESSHRYEHRKPSMHFNATAYGRHEHRKNDGFTASAEFNADPADAYRGAALDSLRAGTASGRLLNSLLYQYTDRTRLTSDLWYGEAKADAYFKIPHSPDYMLLSGDVKVQNEESIAFSDYALLYGAASSASADDRRMRYTPSSNFTAEANAEVSYSYRQSWGEISPFYKLEGRYGNSDYSLYRLDLLGSQMPDFGYLPSTTAALAQTLDAANSYDLRRNLLKNSFGTKLVVYLSGGKSNVYVKPEVQLLNERLDYLRGSLDLHPRRERTRFALEMGYRFNGFYLIYNFSMSDPDLLSMQSYTDNADPLNLYRGNPTLRTGLYHNLNIRRGFANYKKGSRLVLKGYWKVARLAVAHSMDYDATTGVRTYIPRNVDGNWSLGGSVETTRPIDTKKKFVLTSNTYIDFQNSADYVSYRSTVRNLTLREDFKLNMRLGRCELDLDIKGRYLNATSDRTNFTTINSFDLSYGLGARTPLPLGFHLSADATLLHRTGYTDRSMNDLRFVANTRLSKTVLSGRMILTLDCFDIFHGLSNVQSTLNAQALTETWQNSLPAYAMLRVMYKLSKKPKDR